MTSAAAGPRAFQIRHGRKATLVDRFQRFVPCQSEEKNTCWLWVGGKDKDGYGLVGGKRAHRLAWEIENGQIPVGLSVLHKCDVPSCVRASHLFIGTNAQNTADMIAKGRQARGERSGRRLYPERYLGLVVGEKNGGAKLDDAAVATIRRRYRAGSCTYASLGKDYNVSHATIEYIIQGKTWKHVA